RRLARRLRTLRWSRWPNVPALLRRMASYRPHTLTVALLCALSVGLMVTGMVTSAPAVIWAFAVVWPPTLFAVFRLLCRWSGGCMRRSGAPRAFRAGWGRGQPV